MVTKLTLQQILGILQRRPEQSLFDWKIDLDIKDDTKKAELIKDVSAIANGTTKDNGYIFYGVNPNLKNPIVGIRNNLDDAQFQQIVNTKINPEIDFTYYEVKSDGATLGIISIPPTTRKPHIISRDYGRIREGQIFIRRGSSTRGINFNDLMSIFYGVNSPYLWEVLQRYGARAAILRAETGYQKELRAQEQSIRRDMEGIVGLPPGTLSGDF